MLPPYPPPFTLHLLLTIFALTSCIILIPTFLLRFRPLSREMTDLLSSLPSRAQGMLPCSSARSSPSQRFWMIGSGSVKPRGKCLHSSLNAPALTSRHREQQREKSSVHPMFDEYHPEDRGELWSDDEFDDDDDLSSAGTEYLAEDEAIGESRLTSEGNDIGIQTTDLDAVMAPPSLSRPPAFAPASAFYFNFGKPKAKRTTPPLREPLVADPSTADPHVLFRPPPPWSHLDAHISSLLAARAARRHLSTSKSENLGPSAAGFSAAAKDVSGVMSMIGRRRKVDEPPAFGGGSRGSNQPLSFSKNPLRRQSMPGPSLLLASDLQTPGAGSSRLISYRKPRASLPGPVFVSDFPSDVPSVSCHIDSDDTLDPPRAPSPSSPPPFGKSMLKATPQPARALKPITSLPIPPLPESTTRKPHKPVRAPKDKSMSQARIDLQASFAKPKAVSSGAEKTRVLKPPDVGLSKKRPRVESAPCPPRQNEGVKPPAERKPLKPENKPLPSKSVRPVDPSLKKGKVTVQEKAKANAFNWTGWANKPA
jgi:hypothetical protein